MQADKGFKVGDIVEVYNYNGSLKDINGLRFVITQKDVDVFNGRVPSSSVRGNVYHFDNNKYGVNFDLGMLKLVEPKQEQYYTSIPTDVKVGDKFKVINGKGLQANTTFPYYGVSIGSIVTLKKYERELTFSEFTNDKNKAWYYDWGWLKPVKVVTDSHLADIPPTVLFGRDSLSNTDIQQFEIGDEIEVTNNTRPTILAVSVGSKGVIIPTDNPCFFLVDFGNKTQYCKPQQLKLINKTNHNYGKVQNNSMSFSTTSYKITRGETICSSAIRCSKSKIQI